MPIGLSYGLVLGLGVSISFLLGTVCTIFFDMGEGATGVGSSLLLLALDVFADIWSVLPIVLVGVAYRFKRDAALRLIKASQ